MIRKTAMPTAPIRVSQAPVWAALPRSKGSLASLVSAGADAPVTFGFQGDYNTTLTALHLTSQGVELTYSVAGNELTAMAGGREVFTLTIQSNGSYKFELNDQLDHVNTVPGGSEENQTLQPNGVMQIDLGAVLQATDTDFDSVALDGKLTLTTVTDDVPEIAAGAIAQSGSVQEAEIVTVDVVDSPMFIRVLQPSSSINDGDNHSFDTGSMKVLVNGVEVAFTSQRVRVPMPEPKVALASSNSRAAGRALFDVQFAAPEGADVQIVYDHKVGPEQVDVNEGIRLDLYVNGVFDTTIANHTNDAAYVGNHDWAGDSALQMERAWRLRLRRTRPTSTSPASWLRAPTKKSASR